MATRFYLPSGIDSTPAGIAPAFTHQAAWTETDGAVRRHMSTVKRSTAMTSLSLGFANTANTKQLYVQFISDPLAVQTISAAATFKGTIRGQESAINDNINAVSCKVVVVNEDGTALNFALVNLANYGPVAELATSLRAKQIADGDTVSAGGTTNRGDRLVVEIGLTSTVGGTSITGDLSFGDDNATDLGDNETDTTALNPFIEFSHNFVFLQEVGELGLPGATGGMVGRRFI
jgi:hypothetical protein